MTRIISTALALLFVFAAFPLHRAAAQAYPGYTLYGPNNTKKTYLIDMSNTRVQTWTSTRNGGYAVYLLADGSIMRTALATAPQLNGGGAQGVVQRISWTGTLLWEYTYSSSSYISHHDICPMPNGNVLMIAWEVKTAAQTLAAGLDHSASIWPDHIIEVQPTGSSGGNIVWKWHAWDHLIQDHDNTKANYGVVADHPELLDINAGTVTSGDWMHVNSVNYNPDLDQIVFSSHNLNEVYVIDHSTTTAQAASHSGGNSGKGGDFLYRWGNPANFKVTGTKYFDVVHCGSWIPAGLPGAGHIMAFNNKASTGQSIIAEIVPPTNGYNYSWTPGTPYAPTSPTWTYTASGFFSNHLGGVQRLPNGNTLIAQSTSGKMLEVTTGGTTVWSYQPGGEIVRCYRYPLDYSGVLLGGGTPKVSKVEVSAPSTTAWPTVSIPFRVTCQDTVRYGLDKSWFTVLENGSPVSNLAISCPGSGTGMCTLTYTSACPDGTQRPLSFRFSGYCSLDTTVVQTFTVPRDTAAFTALHLDLGEASVQDLPQATVSLDLQDAMSNQTLSPSTFAVHYEKALVDFVSITTPPGSLLAGMSISATPTPEGTAFSIPSGKAITGSGKLADLTFRRVATGAVTTAPLHLTAWAFSAGCFKALHGDGSARFESTQRLGTSLSDSAVIDFGEVILGASATRSFVASSTGASALTLTTLAVSGTNAAEFTAPNSVYPRALAPGKTDTVVLKYTPVAIGTANGVVTLSADDPTRPRFTALLTGVGLLRARRPLLSCSVADSGVLDFGTVAQKQTITKKVALSNTGDATLVISGSAISGVNAADFAITGGAGQRSIAPGQSDTLTLTFTWVATGARSATLAIASNDSTHRPYVITLKGRGDVVDYAVSAHTLTLDFGTVTLGRDTTRAVRFTNGGRLAATVLQQALFGADSAQFSIARVCPSPLAASVSDSVILKFKPLSEGAKTAEFRFRYSDAATGQSIIVALRGNGSGVLRPQFRAHADTLRFDTTTVGASAQRVLLVTNPGNAPLLISTQNISGASASAFSAGTALPHTLQPGDTARLSYAFQPVAAGTAAASLLLGSNDAASPTTTVILLGQAIPAPAGRIAASIARVDFGTVAIGSIKDTSLLISNAGNADLLLGSQSVWGTDALHFGLIAQAPTTLPATLSAPVTLRFAPTAAGARSAVFRVLSNDPATPQLDVALSGVGSIPSAVQSAPVPSGASLEPNYPNPFGPASPAGSGSTVLRVRLARAGAVTLAVRDVFGRLVATLADGVLEAGDHTFVLSAGGLPAGAYFCQLAAGGRLETRTAILLR